MQIFLVIGLVISIIGMFTTKPVADFIAPKKEGLTAIPRTILSVAWYAFGSVFSLISALVFGLALAILN